MTAEEFVAGIKSAVHDSATADVVASVEAPSGRKPAPALLQLSEWYNALSESDKTNVRAMVLHGVQSALFGVFAVIDGVRVIEDTEEKSHFTLVQNRGGVETIINRRRSCFTTSIKPKCGTTSSAGSGGPNSPLPDANRRAVMSRATLHGVRLAPVNRKPLGGTNERRADPNAEIADRLRRVRLLSLAVRRNWNVRRVDRYRMGAPSFRRPTRGGSQVSRHYASDRLAPSTSYDPLLDLREPRQAFAGYLAGSPSQSGG